MRTMFNMGGPLDYNGTRFLSIKDRKEIQNDAAESFINKTKNAIEEIVGKDGASDETGFSGGMVNIM